MGASNVMIACYKIGMTHDEDIPLHYYFKSGSNLEEYLTFIKLLLSKEEIENNTFNKTGKPRDLNISIWLMTNDIGRLYMDQRGMYLSNVLVKIASKVEQFCNRTGRPTRLSYIPYMHAPQLQEHHGSINNYNKYVRKLNKTALASGTYDIDTVLMRIPK